MQRYVDKVVLVTGSTKGIGAQLARRFAGEGASVVVTGRSVDLGEQVAEEIRTSGGIAEFVAGDISRQEDISRVVATAVARFGGLHVLINNAAPVDELADEKNLIDETPEAFERMIRVGLFGTVYACKAAIPELLKAGRGAIVTLSSVAGLEAVDGVPGYACSKGAVQALARQIAGNYGKQGIRSNCIVVGAIYHTDSIASAVIGHPGYRKVLSEVLLTKDGEIGTPDDIAEAALYLASDAARYVNGVLLPVDGGLMCRSSLPNASAAATDEAAGSQIADLEAIGVE